MSKYKKRVKYIRKFGPNLFGFTTKKVKKRKNKPGEHAFFMSNKTAVKESFLDRLQSKQKLKLLFCLNEYQLRNYYKLVLKSQERDPIILLYNILNLRFDVLLYKHNFAKTIPQARQLIVHGFILINGLRMKTPGHLCKIGDVLLATSDIVLENVQQYNLGRVTFDETEKIVNGNVICVVQKPKIIDVNILSLIQQSFEYFF